MSDRHDVVILGGGLAGLTLAIQLRRELPDLDILVLERRQHPVPEAAHKVGRVFGRDRRQLLRHRARTQGSPHEASAEEVRLPVLLLEGRNDLDAVTELGASRYLATPSYQLDRGIFENYLGEHVRERGVHFIDGAVVRRFELGKDGGAHQVSYDQQRPASTKSRRAG